jgi:hypothetical protein
MAGVDLVGLWAGCDRPRGAQRLVQEALGPSVYAHVRGVAQQAARLAVLAELAAEARARLLRAAWLHDVGLLAPGGFAPVAGARMIRRRGHEDTARIVAHRGGAAFEAALRGLPPVSAEFPLPTGEDRELARLLDIALLTTAQDGAPASPAAHLRALVKGRGPDDPSVRTTVWLVDRIGESAALRALMSRVADVGARE